MSPVLPRTDEFDVAVVIPTVAKPEVLLPGFDRLCRYTDGYRVLIVAAVNPIREKDGTDSVDGMRRLFDQHSRAGRVEGCDLLIVNAHEPRGFGGAINDGIAGMMDGARTYEGIKGCGLPPYVVIFNDDLRVSEGWLDGMLRAFDATEVEEWGETPDPELAGRPKRAMEAYLGTGRLGLVGPVSIVVGGIQGLAGRHAESMMALGPDEGARVWREERDGTLVASTFLSGFCWAMTRELVEELSEYAPDATECAETWRWLFDERYEIAGYEDNDLCVRADRAGFRALIAADTYVHHLGHQTFDSEFPEMSRGLRNRLTYYDVWREHRADDGEHVVAGYRVKLCVPSDVHQFGVSLAAHGTLVDGVVILLTGPLSAIARSPHFQPVEKGGHPDVVGLLRDAAEHGDVEALTQWAQRKLQVLPHSRRPSLRVEVWDGVFNERDERNQMIGMAIDEGADWVLSVDHDEVLEPRVNRQLLERLMRHPDPLVSEWDFGFLTHWDSTRLVNQAQPWGDRGSYTGGMRGYRLVRANKAAPRKIIAGGANGLHCGNTPGSDPTCKRTTGMRYRHYGYLHEADRRRKKIRYDSQDPDPNPLLVGGNDYQHLLHEESMVMSPFVADSGIGLHMLLYEKESADDLGRVLDELYGVVDRIVLVWTGDWDAGDREQTMRPLAKFRHWVDERTHGESRPPKGGLTYGMREDAWEAKDWPSTGPSREVARMAEHFGCEWIHHPLADHIGEARNVALDALQDSPRMQSDHAPGYAMGWSLFLDPDEAIRSGTHARLRRMAECSDCWGWLFEFGNPHADGSGSISESVRMARIDPGRVMRIHGRVHETFMRATIRLAEAGLTSTLRRATVPVMNRGLSDDPQAMEDKLAFYRRLTELQLHDDCDDASGWTTLGLYWENEGCPDAARSCFSRAVLCSDAGYLPSRTLAEHHLRIATRAYRRSVQLLSGHRTERLARKALDMLESLAPELTIHGLVGVPPEEGGREPVSDEEALRTLPPFEVTPRMMERFAERAEEERRAQALSDIKQALGQGR